MAWAENPPRSPPANLPAEQAILGAIFLNNKAFDSCAGLEPWHFANDAHAAIFATIKQIIGAGGVADPFTLHAQFANTGQLNEVGGAEYLTLLGNAAVALNVVSEYAAAIRDCALRRDEAAIGEDLIERAYRTSAEHGDGAATAALVIENLEQALTSANVASKISLGDAIAAILEPSSPGSAGHGGLMTGMRSLDEHWGGLYAGSLEIIGARPGTGKTAFGTQVARMLAYQGIGVGFFSLEVDQASFAAANLAAESGVDVSVIRARAYNQEQAQRMVVAHQRLADLPMTIIDGDLSLSQLSSQIRTLKRGGASVSIIDHRNLIRRDDGCERMTKLDWYQYVTQRLKRLAKSLCVTVILLVQCRRDIEQRDDHRPRMSDLEYAGEQDADNIALLHRPELDQSSPPLQGRMSGELHANQMQNWYQERAKLAGVCNVIFVKRRFGKPGTARLLFSGETLTFRENDSDRDHQPAFWQD